MKRLSPLSLITQHIYFDKQEVSTYLKWNLSALGVDCSRSGKCGVFSQALQKSFHFKISLLKLCHDTKVVGTGAVELVYHISLISPCELNSETWKNKCAQRAALKKQFLMVQQRKESFLEPEFLLRDTESLTGILNRKGQFMF